VFRYRRIPERGPEFTVCLHSFTERDWEERADCDRAWVGWLHIYRWRVRLADRLPFSSRWVRRGINARDMLGHGSSYKSKSDVHGLAAMDQKENIWVAYIPRSPCRGTTAWPVRLSCQQYDIVFGVDGAFVRFQGTDCKGSKHRLLTTVSSSTALARTETCTRSGDWPTLKSISAGIWYRSLHLWWAFFFFGKEGGDIASSSCCRPCVHRAERHDQSLADTFFDRPLSRSCNTWWVLGIPLSERCYRMRALDWKVMQWNPGPNHLIRGRLSFSIHN